MSSSIARLPFVYAGLLTLLTAGAAMATEVTVGDTYLAATPEGTSTSLDVISGLNTALVQFALSSIPAGTTAAQIASAQMTVFVNKVNTPGSLSFYVVDSAWSESTADNSLAPVISGTAFFTTASIGASATYVTIDITAEVQAWLNNPGTNFGIAIGSTGSMLLDSKESIATSHPATLDVQFTENGAQGPTGPTGAQGAAGATGSTGATGTNGVAGLVNRCDRRERSGWVNRCDRPEWSGRGDWVDRCDRRERSGWVNRCDRREWSGRVNRCDRRGGPGGRDWCGGGDWCGGPGGRDWCSGGDWCGGPGGRDWCGGGDWCGGPVRPDWYEWTGRPDRCEWIGRPDWCEWTGRPDWCAGPGGPKRHERRDGSNRPGRPGRQQWHGSQSQWHPLKQWRADRCCHLE